MMFETSLSPVPVFGLRRDMNRLLDDMITRSTPSSNWAPAVDVREDGNGIAISVELPGVDPSNVEVTTDNGVLAVRGTKSAGHKEGDENTQWHLVERSYGTFVRTFRLPKGIDEARIGGSYEHGVLTIHVPKAALPKPRKVAIDTRGNSNSNGSGQAESSSAVTREKSVA